MSWNICTDTSEARTIPVCYRAPKKRALEKVAELRARYLWCLRTTLRLMLRVARQKLKFRLRQRQIDDGDTFAGIGCGTGNVSKANAL